MVPAGGCGASLLAGALPVFLSEETEASLAWMRLPPLLLAGAALAASPPTGKGA